MDWDSFIFNKLKSLIKVGSNVVDVGAHEGNYTGHLLNLVGPTGKVTSFELYRGSYEKVKQRFQNSPNVSVINAAVSDRAGTETFYLSPGNTTFQFNIIGHDMNFVSGSIQGTVNSLRLDDVLQGTIDFMKIDVEGAEIRVLHGMEKIAQNVKSILIECHLDKDWPELRKVLMVDYGFSCRDFYSDEELNPSYERRPYQVWCYRK